MGGIPGQGRGDRAGKAGSEDRSRGVGTRCPAGGLLLAGWAGWAGWAGLAHRPCRKAVHARVPQRSRGWGLTPGMP